MRLSNTQKNALKFAINSLQEKVFLFGSRTDDYKKGGDVDICIFSEQEPYKLSQNITVNYWKNCDEKIDVVVINPKKLNFEQELFLKLNQQSFIELNDENLKCQ